MDNTGSFGAAIGGMSPELQAAMQRRQGQGGATAQVSNTAPTMDPTTQPAQPATAPTASADTASAPPPATPGMPFDPSTIKMIVGSFSHVLKSMTKT